MRINSGIFRGRILKSPQTALTHPMGDREKLALFNSLSSTISLDGISVLDCYAGSGALGLEALSRGASTATFVEKDKTAITTIKENVSALGLLPNTKIIKSSTQNFLETNSSKFDLILLDPPYDHFDTEFSPAVATAIPRILSKNGIVALSHPAAVDIVALFPGLELISTKKYAAAHISLYKAQEA